MIFKKQLGKLYWWVLRTFIFNDVTENIFFKKGVLKKINDTPIRLPFKYSWIYPDKYEMGKTNFITSHCKAGDTVIDIGAHIGIFTFFLAKQVSPNGKVYSFEPAPLTYTALHKTIEYNHLNKMVDARQEAVAAINGEITFFLFDNSPISNANSISLSNTSGKPVRVTVKSIMLDSLMNEKNIDNLTLIKIDAEGAELEILKGGEMLIKKFRPFITLEVHPKSFSDTTKTLLELYELIIAYNYKIYLNNKEVMSSEFCDHDNYFEVILLPNNILTA